MKDLLRISNTLSSRYRVREYYENTPASLFDGLKESFPDIDPESWKERIAFGGVFLNGKRILKDSSLPEPCRIEYYQPLYALEEAIRFFPEFSSSWILFEDRSLIACYKPHGLPTMPPKEQLQFCLLRYLEQYLQTSIHMPSRLDMSTAGIILASKSEDTHDAIQKLFQHREIQKEYLLAVDGIIPWKIKEVKNKISHDPKHRVLRMVSKTKGKEAITKFEVLKVDQKQNRTLLKAFPLTGRTHQIRVHISHEGYPIVGDNFYGGSKSEFLHLLSHSLEFEHPLNQEKIHIRLSGKFSPSWIKNKD